MFAPLWYYRMLLLSSLLSFSRPRKDFHVGWTNLLEHKNPTDTGQANVPPPGCQWFPRFCFTTKWTWSAQWNWDWSWFEFDGRRMSQSCPSPESEGGQLILMNKKFQCFALKAMKVWRKGNSTHNLRGSSFSTSVRHSTEDSMRKHLLRRRQSQHFEQLLLMQTSTCLAQAKKVWPCECIAPPDPLLPIECKSWGSLGSSSVSYYFLPCCGGDFARDWPLAILEVLFRLLQPPLVILDLHDDWPLDLQCGGS